MTNYGPKHTIEDYEGTELVVELFGSGAGLTVEIDYGPDLTDSILLTPEQARNLAKQLEAAADDAQPLEPPTREEAASTAAPERSP